MLPETSTPSKTTQRLESLDICRGAAILAVLFIHVSGHFLPVLHPAKSLLPPSLPWYGLAVLNLDAAWAVPCFLMLSAFANARSLARKPDVADYARRRVMTAVLPYVLWSFVYITVNFALNPRHPPGALHIAKLLLTGTAEFHLYFFVLVIELYFLLPLLVPVFQRRPPFWAVALSAFALQAVVYALNRYVLQHRFQTTILWDILPVALGLWLFSQSSRWPEIFKRGRWLAGVVTLAALAIYTVLGVQTSLPHTHINTAIWQFAEWTFTAGASFLVLAGAEMLDKSLLTPVLSYLGAESLAIYVMHPLAIIAFNKLGVDEAAGAGAGMALYYAACLGLPLGAAWVWRQGKAAINRSRPPE